MKLKYPLSMMNVPRQKSFGCFSLRIGSIVFGLLVILYTIYELARLSIALSHQQEHVSSDDTLMMVVYLLAIGAVIALVVTLLLTTVMLIGVLMEKPGLVRPWIIWSCIQLSGYIFIYIFFLAMSLHDNSCDSIVQFLLLLARLYIVMGVASYQSQLKEERDEKLRNLVTGDMW